MRIVGLTGSLATGKSTVADMFRKLGAKHIDADKIAHQCLKRSGECYSKVVKAFGKDILRRGNIDRKLLAQEVFQSKTKIKKLESIIHPAVRKQIRQRISIFRKKKLQVPVIVEVPLLFEAKWDRDVDVIITVAASLKTQLERAKKIKKIPQQQALERINRQWPLKDKIRLADYVIHNNGSLNQLKKKVESIWQKI